MFPRHRILGSSSQKLWKKGLTTTNGMLRSTLTPHKTNAKAAAITPTRHFSMLTPAEEETEKERVSKLSSYQKEMELRNLDEQIAKLNTLRGINTGELYTLRGKFKALARDYGIGFMVWYWTVWCSTAVLTYGAIELGNVDAIAMLAKVDAWTGYEISTKVDPTLGTIGLTLAVNECLEPLRLPVVVLTTKPVVHFFQPGKYRY